MKEENLNVIHTALSNILVLLRDNPEDLTNPEMYRDVKMAIDFAENEMSHKTLKTFYVTFGQTSTARDGWVEVEATNEMSARGIVFAEFGKEWAHIYDADSFNPEPFSLGKFGSIK